MQEVVDEAIEAHVARVPGVAVYLFKDEGAAPPALVSNLRHNHVLHDQVLLVSVHTEDVPRVPDDDAAPRSATSATASARCGSTTASWRIPTSRSPCRSCRVSRCRADRVTYFLGRESVSAGKAPGMHPWREELFVLLNRGAANASRFFKLPADQVFEVGTHVEI